MDNKVHAFIFYNMFKNVEIKKELCLKNIYKKISEEQIIQSILPGAKPGRFFSIRNEKNTSASLTSYNGKLYIKDFGDALQDKAETWYQYIARNNGWDYSTREGFLQSLIWANRQFKLNLNEPNLSNVKSFPISTTKKIIKSQNTFKSKVKIEVKRRDWTSKDLEYWNQFGLTLEWLESKRISPLSHYWITNSNKDNIRRCFDVSNKLVFVYPYYRDESGHYMYKIYSPLESSFKWLSNVTSHVIENWRFIKKHKTNLIIQSSLKDIGVMEYFRDTYGIFKDYDFISPISEGIWFNGNWSLIRGTYKKIVYYGNNDYDKKDNPGLAYARKWSKEYTIPFIINPDWCKASDISDFRKLNGEEATKELLIKLENKIKLL